MGKGKMFLIFFTLKLLSVFVIKTAYVPDEYWQSLEVAHRMVFGYGHMTWEWSEGLRSYIYPAIIAGLYKILQFFSMDSRDALIILPRILQALISSFGDYFFWLWVREQTGTKGNWAALTIATSWFWFYCGSRTIINTVETSLTIFALYLYPWTDKDIYAGKSKFLLPVGLACIMRPTTLVIWIPLFVHHLARVHKKSSVILRGYLTVSSLSVLACLAIDSYFYGKITFTPWNFFRTNVLGGIGAFYGIMSSYWYIIIGLPAVLGVYIIPFLYGAWKVLKARGPAIEFVLLFVIAWTTFIFSILAHKEFRFVLPILPMALFICSRRLSQWSRTASNLLLWTMGIILLVGNAVPAVYFGLYHQRGTVDVMEYLAGEAGKNQTNTNILFLMPCHSTPLYSHLHVNVPVKFLSCEPDLSAKPGYMDEADVFYLGPLTWMNKKYTANSVLPSHIVMFDVLQPILQGFLNSKGYTSAAKFFHTHHYEGRIGEHVVVHSLI